MNDRKLDQLLRRAISPADAVLGSLDLSRGGDELLEEIIMSTPTTPLNPAEPPAPPPGDINVLELPLASALPAPRRHRRALIGVAAAAAFVTAVAGPALVLRGGNDVSVAPGKTSAPAPAPAAASVNPRVLVDDPAWKVVSASEFDASNGEIQFSNGGRELEVHWYSSKRYQEHRADRRTVSKPAVQRVLGRDGELFTYSSKRFAVVLPPQGKSFLEIGGEGTDKQAFIASLAKLKTVSAEQWMAAMPDSVVKQDPDQWDKLARQILSDIPLVPDRTITWRDGVSDLYDFKAQVIGSATCSWLDKYETARKAHDQDGMAEVAKALGTSRDWKTLKEMGGEWPKMIWQYADLVADRESIPPGSEHGNVVELGYETSLGCAEPGSEGSKSITVR